MASTVDINDKEFEEIKQEYSQIKALAIQIIYRWQKKNPSGSTNDLQKFLLAVGQTNAAKRFANYTIF